MKWILIISLFTAINGFSQKDQHDFTFLIGLERTDPQVKTYLTTQFGLFDEEYEAMWKLGSEKFDNWDFYASSAADEDIYDFPLHINVSSGKITSVLVRGPEDMSPEGYEKWKEFFEAEFPGGFRFNMTKKELKKKYDTDRFKPYSIKAPWAMLKMTGKLMGYTTTLDNRNYLEINGTGGKKRPVTLLIYSN